MSADVTLPDFPTADQYQYDARELAAIRQQERFDWFAERLADRADTHTVEELVDKLGSAPLWPGQWEKAIVMLALKATPEAVRALIDVDVSEASDSFRSLYEYCLARAVDDGTCEM